MNLRQLNDSGGSDAGHLRLSQISALHFNFSGIAGDMGEPLGQDTSEGDDGADYEHGTDMRQEPAYA